MPEHEFVRQQAWLIVVHEEEEAAKEQAKREADLERQREEQGLI